MQNKKGTLRDLEYTFRIHNTACAYLLVLLLTPKLTGLPACPTNRLLLKCLRSEKCVHCSVCVSQLRD